MNELIDRSDKLKEISVMFTFTNGCTFTQQVPMKFADMVEEMLSWYRSKKSKPTWTWDYTPIQEIRIFQKSHITAIDIVGYIELTKWKQTWYEKLFDKLLTFVVFTRLKGGEHMKKKIVKSAVKLTKDFSGKSDKPSVLDKKQMKQQKK